VQHKSPQLTRVHTETRKHGLLSNGISRRSGCIRALYRIKSLFRNEKSCNWRGVWMTKSVNSTLLSKEHGKNTDRATQISAIDAGPHGNTETRIVFERNQPTFRMHPCTVPDKKPLPERKTLQLARSRPEVTESGPVLESNLRRPQTPGVPRTPAFGVLGWKPCQGRNGRFKDGTKPSFRPTFFRD
jgi:hypothetical protein